MKRAIFLCVMIFLGIQMLVVAQPPQHTQRTPEQEAAKHTEMMKRDLQLSEEQVDTIYRLNLKYAQLRRLASSREELFQNLDNKKQELKTLLTPQQFEQYIIQQQTRRAKRQCVVKLPVDTVANTPNSL